MSLKSKIFKEYLKDIILESAFSNNLSEEDIHNELYISYNSLFNNDTFPYALEIIINRGNELIDINPLYKSDIVAGNILKPWLIKNGVTSRVINLSKKHFRNYKLNKLLN